MSTAIVQVDSGRVVLALGRFQLGIRQNEELMRTIGASMLVSVRRTFREQGSPAGSWAPLAASTIRSNPKKYGPGHKLLIDKGTLLNSITFAPFSGGVTIGTNLVYARVQQEGSADRRGAAIGPQAKIAGRSVTVGAHTRGSDFKTRIGRIRGGRVKEHQRHQNIPPRPYLVFRPEDPARIRGLVVAYVNRERKAAGLGGTP